MLLLLLVLPWLAGCDRPALHRPGAVDPRRATDAKDNTGIQFEDVAASSGIQYRWPKQLKLMRNIEALGCGCAFLDFDRDGWQDILLVDPNHLALYHNTVRGRFEDVTRIMCLDQVRGEWRGIAVGDYNGDGFPDLLLTGYRCLALLRNEGGKRFVDVTKEAGLDPYNHGDWATSAGFMDLRGNGRLDLVLLNYVITGPKDREYCELAPGVRTGCPPQYYRPEFPELWRNDGNGRFTDVTSSSGMRNTHGKALVVAFADVDHDGRIDFFIGNDGQPADLMKNLGGLRFKNMGASSGAANGSTGFPIAAMGADWGDYDRDGRLDLAVTAFSNEPYSLLRNRGGGVFEHTGDSEGITGPTMKPLGFGTKWIDVDNDGWPDLAFANGHVYENTSLIDPLSTFRQPLMLFHNERGQQFVDLVPRLGGDMARPILGRGLATGDFDNDGRVDMLVVDYEGTPLLLHNVSRTANHWITLDLRGGGSNKLAYGAQVTARAQGQVWVGQVSPASSYLSSSDPRVHFGLGQVRVLDSVSIHWPDGREERLEHVGGDAFLTIVEGRGIAARTETGVHV